jgi:hypothetical protein
MSEVWRQILNSRFQVSNRGNVRYINANGDLVMR